MSLPLPFNVIWKDCAWFLVSTQAWCWHKHFCLCLGLAGRELSAGTTGQLAVPSSVLSSCKTVFWHLRSLLLLILVAEWRAGCALFSCLIASASWLLCCSLSLAQLNRLRQRDCTQSSSSYSPSLRAGQGGRSKPTRSYCNWFSRGGELPGAAVPLSLAKGLIPREYQFCPRHTAGEAVLEVNIPYSSLFLISR